MGAISIILGIVAVAVNPDYEYGVVGSGIWTGVFIVIAGSLCIAAGVQKHNKGLRLGAFIMLVIALVLGLASAALDLMAFV